MEGIGRASGTRGPAPAGQPCSPPPAPGSAYAAAGAARRPPGMRLSPPAHAVAPTRQSAHERLRLAAIVVRRARGVRPRRRLHRSRLPSSPGDVADAVDDVRPERVADPTTRPSSSCELGRARASWSPRLEITIGFVGPVAVRHRRRVQRRGDDRRRDTGATGLLRRRAPAVEPPVLEVRSSATCRPRSSTAGSSRRMPHRRRDAALATDPPGPGLRGGVVGSPTWPEPL